MDYLPPPFDFFVNCSFWKVMSYGPRVLLYGHYCFITMIGISCSVYVKLAADFFKKNWANHGLFFVFFRSFQTNNTNLTTNQCEKCRPSSIMHWDSNPRPSECESPPITTWPGLPPIFFIFYSEELLSRLQGARETDNPWAESWTK